MLNSGGKNTKSKKWCFKKIPTVHDVIMTSLREILWFIWAKYNSLNKYLSDDSFTVTRTPKWILFDQHIRRIVDNYDDYTCNLDFLRVVECLTMPYILLENPKGFL